LEAILNHKICEFYKLCHDSIKNFPKTERYSLGQKTENTILELLELTLKASFVPRWEKMPYLKEADQKINLLKILIRVSGEIKILRDKKYFLLEERLQEIGRMLGGWIKNTQERQKDTV
jgi:hypothetical protein